MYETLQNVGTVRFKNYLFIKFWRPPIFLTMQSPNYGCRMHCMKLYGQANQATDIIQGEKKVKSIIPEEAKYAKLSCQINLEVIPSQILNKIGCFFHLHLLSL